MHELSLANEIIDKVCEIAKNHGVEKIITIRISVGPLSGVDSDSLSFCFTESSFGTLAEEAILIVEKTPLLISCLECKKVSEVNVNQLLCPHCNHFGIEIVSGKEFKIIDLEVVECVKIVAAKKEIHEPTSVL
jgi:hydrogenase nickel incorporation protein HypA/HybF